MASKYQERFQFKSIQLFKDQVLGIGEPMGRSAWQNVTYFSTCAAKIMHETLFDPLLNKKARHHHEHRLPFSRECEFLSVMRNPNIVQHLGKCQDSDTPTYLLMELMELMDNSLTHFLVDSPVPLPFHAKISVNVANYIS